MNTRTTQQCCCQSGGRMPSSTLLLSQLVCPPSDADQKPSLKETSQRPPLPSCCSSCTVSRTAAAAPWPSSSLSSTAAPAQAHATAVTVSCVTRVAAAVSSIRRGSPANMDTRGAKRAMQSACASSAPVAGGRSPLPYVRRKACTAQGLAGAADVGGTMYVKICCMLVCANACRQAVAETHSK